jgi:large subunit GTPase 1
MKKKQGSSLGKSLIKDRFKRENVRHSDRDAPREMNSVTQETDLQEFLNSAILADQDFTATKLNFDHSINFQSAALDSKAKTKMHQKYKSCLKVPRRPAWTAEMTKDQLLDLENKSFLEWRRDLAALEEVSDDLILTPFEKNLNIWRQLWRTIERSVLLVEIVDARNPTLFMSSDLLQYIASSGKKHVLLINKADLLSFDQRKAWGEYLNKQGIDFIFFSAAWCQMELLEEEFKGKLLQII